MPRLRMDPIPILEDEGDTVVTTVRVGERLLERIQAIAKETNRATADVIRYFIRAGIKEHEAKKSGKR